MILPIKLSSHFPFLDPPSIMEVSSSTCLISLGFTRGRLNNRWPLTPLQSSHLENTGGAGGANWGVALAELATFRPWKGAASSREV